jgi:hypothetical protein
MRLDSTLKKLSPIYLGPKNLHFDALDECEIGNLVEIRIPWAVDWF